MKKSIDVKTATITFTFDNPHGLVGLEPVVFDTTKCAESVREYAELHGFMARVGDNAAIARKDAGGTVTEAMRREAVLELVNYYEGGADKWEITGRTRAPTQNATILKIAAAMNITYAEAEAEVQRRMLDEISA